MYNRYNQTPTSEAQFGNQGAQQFGQSRKEWPFIARKTVLLDHGGAIIAEVNGILPYEQIRTRYRDVGTVLYSCNVKFANQWVNGLDIAVPIAAMEQIKTPGSQPETDAVDTGNPLADIMGTLMSDPKKLAVLSKLMGGQTLEQGEQMEIASFLKSIMGG